MCLLAPDSGRVLAGEGPSEVHEILPFDGPELARRLAGEATNGPLAAVLSRAGAVVAYTRSEALAEAVRPRNGPLLAHDPAPPPASGHVSHWLARPIAALDLPSGAEPPPLGFSAPEQVGAAPFLTSLPEHFLALHPGSGGAAKCWPLERFEVLAQRLAGEAPFLVVLGPAETGQEWRHVPGAVVARDLPLRVLGALLSRAGLFVGNDSGVSHLAAAAGAPTLALFGPTDPEVWSPVGRVVRCLRASDHTLAGLPVDTVAEAARALQAAGEDGATSAASAPRPG